MAFDPHANFVSTVVTTPPSPPLSGNTLIVANGSVFPSQAGFNAIIYQAGVFPNSLNTEIVRVTNITGDTLTITRQAESSTARTILVNDVITMSVTAKLFTDIETALNITTLMPQNSNVAFLSGQLCIYDDVWQKWCPLNCNAGVLGVSSPVDV